MHISCINGILDKTALARVHAMLDCGRFVDGTLSAEAGTAKNNLELAHDTREYLDVLDIVESAVRSNADFNFAAFPRYMTRPIISRYDVGMYYREHVDSPVMGFMTPLTTRLSPLGTNYVRSDLSLTLFLSPPDSYDGGELCFEMHPARTKLEAGSAVLYPSGLRHSVSTVTRGVRVAAIFWIQTMFPIEAHRRAIIDANRLANALRTSADSETYLLARDHFLNLSRLLAEV